MSENAELPQPDPALRRLDRLVGRGSMEGHLVGSDETNVRGETSFRWLPGGFFLEQRVQIDFMALQLEHQAFASPTSWRSDSTCSCRLPQTASQSEKTPSSTIR